MSVNHDGLTPGIHRGINYSSRAPLNSLSWRAPEVHRGALVDTPTHLTRLTTLIGDTEKLQKAEGKCQCVPYLMQVKALSFRSLCAPVLGYTFCMALENAHAVSADSF